MSNTADLSVNIGARRSAADKFRCGARHGKNGVILVPDDLRIRVSKLYAKLGQRRKAMGILGANETTFAALVDYGALRYDVIDRIYQVLEDIGA